jgi:hypothetical protein
MAFAPTVSYLLASARGLQVIEICSSFGIKRITLDASGSPIDPQPASPESQSHCSFCIASLSPCTGAASVVTPGVVATAADFQSQIALARFQSGARSGYRARAPPAATEPS